MSFPYHDQNWVAVADRVRARAKAGDRILAPDIFWWLFPKIHRYRDPFLRPQAEYDWAILHKGELDRLPRGFPERMTRMLPPVFANDVFVVLGRATDGALDPHNPHVRALLLRLDELARQGPQAPLDFTHDPILPDPGSISQLPALSDHEIAAAMDAFWTNGGYLFETIRDRAYEAEIERHISMFLTDNLPSGPEITA